MIQVKDVSLTIKKTAVLRHVTVDFEQGKIHGLIGRNRYKKSSNTIQKNALHRLI